MKKLLLPVIALISTGAFAQTYFEDDFSGGMGSWTVIDEDGDGFEWGTVDYGAGDGHGNVASSASWDGGVGPLTPNNIMVAGPIDLSGASGSVFLTWQVKGQDQSYADENYTAYAATGGMIVDLLATPYSFNEVVGPTGGNYVGRMLDITDLVGEPEVYIAFRHHDVTDEFRLNIDDVMVRTVPEFDIEMLTNTTPIVTEPGTVEISGTIRNNGYGTITSFDIDWNDGTSHVATITADVEPFETYSFTHSDELTATEGTVYEMTICASIEDDSDDSNDCLEAAVTCVDEIPTKYVVGEEKTGTWCGWCPRGAVALENMESEERFIGIAVHNGDPMVIPAYDSGINTYVPGGYPGAGVDRVIPGDPSEFLAMFNARKDEIPLASIEVEVTDAGDDYEVTVSATFIANLEGDYRLASVITEDRVTGTGSGYAQVNYYSGGGAGPMEGYEDLPNPVPAADMVYDHVARALGNNEILGEPGSLPASIDAGSTESYTYTIAKGATWNPDWLHFIGMLVNGSTGEIINAGKTHLTYTGIENVVEEGFNVSLYPNPASDIAQMELNLNEVSNVTVQVFNNLGEVVYTNESQNLSAGAYIYSIDVQDFAPGMYIVRTTANNAVKTTKLSVQ